MALPTRMTRASKIAVVLMGVAVVTHLLTTYVEDTTTGPPLTPIAPATTPVITVTWQPIGVSFILSFDTQGNFKIEGSAIRPTPWGIFGVHFGQSVPVAGASAVPPGASPPPTAVPTSIPGQPGFVPPEPRPRGGFVLTLRDFRRPPDEVHRVFLLQSGDDDPIDIVMDSRSTVRVSDHHVFIDVTNVRCLSVSKAVAPDQNKWTRCVSYNATEGWLENHQYAEMWSGPPTQAGVISFGTTSKKHCSFLRVRPEQDGRILVLNPYTDDVFWIDAWAVGPVKGPPPRIETPNPPDQNCEYAIHDR